ncbi:MAG: hypothetical protein MSE71_00835 [Christensenellaceae bacterium]|nr:hypothetical protein [Christensenellaceae bacterium]
MADSFGLKIGLEGEKEFKKALAEINQSFKVLGSEMKLATSQFDKNDKSVEALAARNKVLRKEIDEQTTKIDTLRKALQNAATSFGENDRRTQNWQIQLNNVEAALNDMNRELDENEKAIKEDGKAAEESGSKFEGFGKVLKTVGVALGAVAVAAGAAAVKLGKEVIAAYADYEQLVGGVDTLFKDSSQEIQRYAANAYKTAGLSANEYMETVTGFSASLIQSLGGDTEKAAKYADMAITDMSDNANKMGTDMSSIQNAYQGFAKQNYTMLDNLKLGYGGTKQEMERLLADAEKISGIKYDIIAIVEAIPKIIDGIINAVLNAIPQIIQAGIDLLISLIQALPQIITTIVQAIPQIISGIVNALIGNIDKIIMAGVQLFVALIENLPTIIVEIVKAVPQIIAGIVKAFGSLMYKIVEIGGNIVKGLWSGITQLASWLWDKVSGWISSIWDGICDFFGIHSPSKEMAWVGEMLVKGLAGSIDDNGDEAVKAAEGMAEDINGVMGDLAHDMQTALPTDFDVNGSIRSTVDGMVGKAASAFTIALNITNFNNYSSEDIRQLTNEVMETANQFAQRKGVVFA